ncbi:carboxypeptidase-like regulatory domain-containing protein [Limibacter armeniacum]|uniref:TonB-dependent receptor n=1 Tax=Limibacter armeniacum TaxID=466084 RepID=UPI002FE50673
MLRILFILICTSTISFHSLSQENNAVLTGLVVNSNGEPLPGVTIQLKEISSKGAITNEEGKFEVRNIPKGDYTLIIRGVGFINQHISISYPFSGNLTITLKDDAKVLQNVDVNADKQAKEITESGLNTSIIDVSQFQDMNLDISQLVEASAGVNIRRSGGLGATNQVSINGLSGKQVRFFIDGISMDFLETTLNDLPANIIRSVEIYKGVVPIELASDALGGAINIRTVPPKEELLDVSYSYGSFNTHRSSIVLQKNNNKGLFLRLLTFLNHSDNNYWMDGMPIADSLGNISTYSRVRRFHDQYTSGTANLKFGITDKKIADILSVDFFYSGKKNNMQHPEVSINRVYGGLHSQQNSLSAMMHYLKKWGDFSIEAKTVASQKNSVIYDTLSRRYNWAQEYKYVTSERYDQKSIFHMDDQIFTASLNAKYQVTDQKNLSFNAFHHQVNRQGSDEINENNHAFEFPNKLSKDIISISGNHTSLNERLRASLFAKQYFFKSIINTEEYLEGEFQNVETKADLVKTGYGATASYMLHPSWVMKLSFEKAYRLPESIEILGDGVFVLPSPDLIAESSHNLNYGIIFKKDTQANKLKSEANLFFRPAKDFIRYVNDRGVYGSYHNIADVNIIGIESSTLWKWQNKYAVDFNWTYQSITDQSKYSQGTINENRGNRVPNTPYFFWNIRLGYNLNLAQSNRMTFNWTSSYVHEFFLYWEGMGEQSEKNKIPTQFTNDLDISYIFKEGKYSVSLASRNIFDAKAYDNFSIQKPGRAFYLKFRFYLNNN